MQTLSTIACGTGGTKHLPTKDNKGVYHMEGELVLADKSGIKDLTDELVPFIIVLREEPKTLPVTVDQMLVSAVQPRLMSPAPASCSAWEWQPIICEIISTAHSSQGPPPKKNFRVLGIGPHKGDIPLDKGRDLAAIWGSDPLHWAPAAYHIIIETVLKGAQA